MRQPFKMFFGLSIGIMLFFFLARIAFVAFIAAGIMSIIYAVYRRIKDFITYDRYGEYYIQVDNRRRLENHPIHEVEPLFYERKSMRATPISNIQFIDAV